MGNKRAIKDLSFDELSSYVASCGESSYRAKQLIDWLYKKNIHSFDDAKNISKTLREQLKKDFSLCSLKERSTATSKAGDSIKYLFETEDGCCLESVLIKNDGRMTLCVSTQIGCKYACAFCASGKGGFIRNLTVAEIVDQYYFIEQLAKEKITNIVFMGMGEPFDNYENVTRSITLFTSERGAGLGRRRITVSTAGIIPGIERFSSEGFLQIKLSISLHAVTQEKRKKIMPVAKKYPLDELLKTLIEAKKKFKRRITLEYIVLKEFNDSQEDVNGLARIAKQLGAKVNLIGYNIVDDENFKAPTREDVDAARKRLEDFGIIATVRYSAGSDIAAACGQLRCTARIASQLADGS